MTKLIEPYSSRFKDPGIEVKSKIKKGRKLARKTKFQDMDVSIETDKGQERHWTDPHSGEKGTTKMKYPYGYIRRTVGADDEHVDCFIGPNKDEKTIYVIHQLKAPKFEKYDEDKVMLGFESPKDAKQAYLAHYNTNKFFGSMDEMSVDKFKENFVNKALNPLQQDPQPSMQAPVAPAQEQPGQPPMVPMYDPFDITILPAVESMLNRIGGMNDKDLARLVKEVWGEGYEYKMIGDNHIRAEMRGFLQDQAELLKVVHPMLMQGPYLPDPSQLPHTSNFSPTSMPGNENSVDQSKQQNLGNETSTSTESKNSNQQGFFEKLGMGTR